nr:MAG TPA: hypothetical protein [Caudoviricetes sp.]
MCLHPIQGIEKLNIFSSNTNTFIILRSISLQTNVFMGFNTCFIIKYSSYSNF